ncbi:MAG: 2-isopropylmalate synthase, partial [Oscillospiraceae bacterium]|nr:2-isopropylmalate synthase [Oscillospiraceae bacterium]
PIHMEYKLRMSPEQVAEQVAAMTAYAKKYCADIQFSAEDASRSDWAFLSRIFAVAIQNGATTINVPDTVGYSHPDEMKSLFAYLAENVPGIGIGNVTLSAHCHNDLGLAVSNSLAAVMGGAGQIECAVNGIGERAGNAALEELVMALHIRRDTYQSETRIDTTQLYRTSRLLQSVTGVAVAPNKAVVGANAFAHEAGIHQHGVMAERTTYEIMSPTMIGLPRNKMVLGKHSGKHAFEERLKDLGFALSDEELQSAFLLYKELADKKKTVLDGDLEALVGSRGYKVPGQIELSHFVINAGNSIDGTAIIKLRVGDAIHQNVAMGDGPVDAAFKAINKIVGEDFALESYQLGAVTEGGDAMGECVLRVRLGEDIATGRGLSTDIIEATIKAYIHAANKLLNMK